MRFVRYTWPGLLTVVVSCSFLSAARAEFIADVRVDITGFGPPISVSESQTVFDVRAGLAHVMASGGNDAGSAGVAAYDETVLGGDFHTASIALATDDLPDTSVLSIAHGVFAYAFRFDSGLYGAGFGDSVLVRTNLPINGFVGVSQIQSGDIASGEVAWGLNASLYSIASLPGTIFVDPFEGAELLESYETGGVLEFTGNQTRYADFTRSGELADAATIEESSLNAVAGWEVTGDSYVDVELQAGDNVTLGAIVVDYSLLTSAKAKGGMSEAYSILNFFNTGSFELSLVDEFGNEYPGVEFIRIPSVPEPSTISLLAFGVLGLSLLRRRFRR